MWNGISNNFINEIKKPSREFKCKIVVGMVTLTEDDVCSITIEHKQATDKIFGSAMAKSLELEIINNNKTILWQTNPIEIYIGLKINNTIEYIPQGKFYVTDIEKSKLTIKLSAMDAMGTKLDDTYLLGGVDDLITINDLKAKITNKTKIEFSNKSTFTNYTIKNPLGAKYREIIGYLACLYGGNAVIDREGKILFISLRGNNTTLTLDVNNYSKLKLEETDFILNKLICETGEETLSVGNGVLTNEIAKIACPLMTIEILKDVFNKLKGYSTTGYSLEWQGSIILDPYDCFTLTDTENTVLSLQNMSEKIFYTGGVKSSSDAKQIKSDNVTGTSTINGIGSTGGASSGGSGGGGGLTESDIIKIQAIINEWVDNGNISADKITVGILEGSTAILQTILTNFITGEQGQFIHLTGDNVVIEEAVIKDAMIDEVSAGKITAGIIDTSIVNISSKDGKMIIRDNTIQINDSNRTRVQIGKMANNDYSISVFDAAGKLMFDASGLTEDGIKSSIIRDDMISNEANINGGKIDMNSLFNKMNEDGSNTLLLSKLKLDGENQTFDLIFKNLTTKVDDVESVTNSNQTSIKTQQGKIEQLIKDTTIVKNDTETKLKDAYNETVNTVNSQQNTLSEHTSTINSLTGSIESVGTKLNKVERDLNGTSSIVSENTKKIEDLNKNLETTTTAMETAIKQSASDIKLEASRTYLTQNDAEEVYASKTSLGIESDKIVASFEKSGAYNLIENSTGFNKVKNGWANTSNQDVKILAGYLETKILETGYYLGLNRNGETAIDANAAVSKRFKLSPNETYTFSCKTAVNSQAKGIKVMIRTSNTIDASVENDRKTYDNTYVVYEGKPSGWKSDVYTFTAPSKVLSGIIYIEHLGYDSTSTATSSNVVFWADLMLVKGTLKKQWSQHPMELYNGSTIIDGSGITVNNGALRIKNNAGTTVLEGDDKGNLVLTGTMKSQSGDMWVGLDSGGLSFQDWNRKEQLLRMATSYFSSNRDYNGISVAMPQYSDYFRFVHINKADLTNGWSASDTQYTFMDFWSGDRTVGSTKYYKGINMFAALYVRNTVKFFNTIEIESGSNAAHQIFNTSSGRLGIFGDNGLSLGARISTTNKTAIEIKEVTGNSYGTEIELWTDIKGNGRNIYNVTINKMLVNASTRSVVQTNHMESELSQIRVNFEDVELKNGKAILNIPNKYVYLHNGYIVSSIVKKGRGDVWVSHEEENRFIIEGDTDIKVNVELIIKIN